MEHDSKSRRSRWRLPRVLGTVALTGALGAGLLAVALPAATALASPASPAATAAPSYSLDFLTSVKALGHKWNIDFSVSGDNVDLVLATAYGSTTEDYDWASASGVDKTVAKDLKVTSTGHASFRSGTALSPVLSANISFTPVKATKGACTKGSDTTYAGKISGALTLVTQLDKVKFNLKFSGKTVGELDADKSCTPVTKPTKTACTGGDWFVSGPGTGFTNAAIDGAQSLGSKPKWQDEFFAAGAKTASKWLTRTLFMTTSGPVPVVHTANKTVAVAGSGAITGAALISYSQTFPEPATTCYFGGKKYKEATTGFLGTGVKLTKAFQAHALLAGTVAIKTGSQGFYTAVKLSAP